MIGFTISLNKRRRRHYRKNEKSRRRFLFFLPVILIAVFSLCASFFLKEDDVKEKNYSASDIQVFKSVDDYSAYYNPIVINGFFEYEEGDEIENEMLVKLGVWSILCTEEREKYEAFDGGLSIKKEEVEERVRMIFSEKIKFENVSSGEILFDEGSGYYTIPVLGFSPEYSAVLESVRAEKDKTKLTVGCLRSESFKQNSSGKTVLPEADKRIVITLVKNKSSYSLERITAASSE